jgi:alkylated DNA nucleotide flippase Atl1
VDDEFVEQVLSAVEAIPPGKVASYGEIAELLGRGGPRQVGWVMSHHGSAVPWWRVVRADGRPARGHEDQALRLLLDEGTPLRGERVDLAGARIADDHLDTWRERAVASTGASD